ncbi:MAG: hypothetical protein GQ535_01270 [Rhodobacteraceae bacterium]|nr:hypothetical protein [Paracoccaceae bacterium]
MPLTFFWKKVLAALNSPLGFLTTMAGFLQALNILSVSASAGINFRGILPILDVFSDAKNILFYFLQPIIDFFYLPFPDFELVDPWRDVFVFIILYVSIQSSDALRLGKKDWKYRNKGIRAVDFLFRISVAFAANYWRFIVYFIRLSGGFAGAMIACSIVSYPNYFDWINTLEKVLFGTMVGLTIHRLVFALQFAADRWSQGENFWVELGTRLKTLYLFLLGVLATIALCWVVFDRLKVPYDSYWTLIMLLLLVVSKITMHMAIVVRQVSVKTVRNHWNSIPNGKQGKKPGYKTYVCLKVSGSKRKFLVFDPTMGNAIVSRYLFLLVIEALGLGTVLDSFEILLG